MFRSVTSTIAAAIAALLVFGVGGSLALGTPASYSKTVFADGFESGSLSAWNGTSGPGSASVTAAAARTGSFGLRLTNTNNKQVSLLKNLPAPLVDSSVRFSVRIASPSGTQLVARGRDATGAKLWELAYDGANRGFLFSPYRGGKTTPIFTGTNVPAPSTWASVEVQYTATSSGGAQLYVNGTTKSAWRVTGDYSRTSHFQSLQLWNDTTSTTDFDIVSVATPPTPPDAPTGVAGSPSDRAVTLTWAAPANDGGSPITGYRVTPYVGATAQAPILTGSTAATYVVTGLTNGTTYTFRVAAVNALGAGADSDASAPVTPRTLPGAPTGVAGASRDRAVDLTWNAPASDGGSAISGYRITPSSGGVAQAAILTGSSSTTHTVTGLTNGTTYTFTVAAVNAAGTGPDSAASSPVTPLGPPAAPTAVTAAPRDRAAVVRWTAPASDGGSAITGYRITPAVDGVAQAPEFAEAEMTSHTVTGLTNGTAYTFTVAAVSAVGTGPESAPSAPVTPIAAKTVVSLTFDDNVSSQWSARQVLKTHAMPATFYVNSGLTGNTAGGFRMTWTQLEALAADGHEITGHTLTHKDLTRLTTEEQRTEVCNDRQNLLSRGFSPVSSFAYPYGSYAQNNARAMVQECGYSSGRTVGGLRSSLCPTCPVAESIPPRDPFVMRTPPDIRNTTTLEAMQSYVTRAEEAGGGWVQLVFHEVCDSCGDEYSVTLSRLTAFLEWLSSRAATGTVVKTVGEVIATAPAPAPPGAPTNVTGTPTDGAVSLTWTAPTDTGGREITGYRVTPYAGGTAQPSVLTGSAATSYTLTGLTNGTAYTFTVAAINVAGEGPESAPSAPVTPAEQPSNYTHVVFADGFESGSTSAWSGVSGTGSVSVTSEAAQAGAYGVRVVNQSGQHAVVAKTLSAALVESSVSFWVRPGSPPGMQIVAQARDQSSSARMWDLIYDGSRRGFFFYPFRGTTATEIFTGSNTVAADTWVKVEIRYTATSSGGAQLRLNGQTKPGWQVAGDYTRSANLQRVQLWNDAVSTTDFDEVRVATTPPPDATVPGAPTAVSGTAGNRSVALSWTAPASDGGSAITSYRITPYVEGLAQAATITGSAATRHLVSGLTNGTSYVFKVAAINAAGTGPDSDASAPVTPTAPPPPVAMPVISRDVPAHTNDTCATAYPAKNANDSNYRSLWRTCNSAVSESSPKWLAYDLSAVPTANRSSVAVAWFNDPMTGPYDHTVSGGAAYNIPGSYTIEVNAAPGGTAAPTDGWTAVAAVTGNTFNSRQHTISMSGYNWLRIHVTASNGSPSNADVALNMDVHDASGGTSDDWIFFGDTITQDGLLHDNRTAASGATVGTFSQLVNAAKPGYFPLYQNGGIGALSSSGGASRIATWLALFPGRYVALSFGTNDALAAAGDPSIAGRYYTNMEAMVQAALAAGKTPIIPTIPWGRHANLQVNVPVLNEQIVRLLSAYPQAIPGPDLYGYFQANQDLIAADGIHPTWDHGYAAVRQEWANFAVSMYP